MPEMRCAIYARYSSDLQRESSVEDQIRNCREFAKRQGWIILENYVRSDQAVSGAALAGRDALLFLVEEAKKKPRPFDRLLVDDTSRLARNVVDGLKIIEGLQYVGVFFTAVSQGIDSEQKTARQLLTLHGMMDEQFLSGLADKVHRGQEGRVLQGLHPGGKCFGYTNAPIEDPHRQGKYGRPAILGVRLEINPQEAVVVRRIFQMHADGMGLAEIAKTLNRERVPSPQGPRSRLNRSWCPSSIREMLRNERYRGVHVWNRTEKQRNPEPAPTPNWLAIALQLYPCWRSRTTSVGSNTARGLPNRFPAARARASPARIASDRSPFSISANHAWMAQSSLPIAELIGPVCDLIGITVIPRSDNS